jgi:hypothetical protein
MRNWLCRGFLNLFNAFRMAYMCDDRVYILDQHGRCGHSRRPILMRTYSAIQVTGSSIRQMDSIPHNGNDVADMAVLECIIGGADV